MGKLRHKNLVKLIGYCEECENRLLVYEFMPKGCLENHLFRSELFVDASMACKLATIHDAPRLILGFH